MVASAAVLHAKFKTSWTTNGVLIERGLQHIKNLLESVEDQPGRDASNGSGLDEEDDNDDMFFRPKKHDASPN
jgi:hypothetical protein